MAEFVIDADGHIMEDHSDIFAHVKGNFSEMNWHTTWPMFDADGWQRGLSRKGKREDPDAEAWIRSLSFGEMNFINQVANMVRDLPILDLSTPNQKIQKRCRAIALQGGRSTFYCPTCQR